MRSSDGLPLVAIVGRPNVGKSTLFNRIVGEKVALVHDEAGVTRDRNYARVLWGDRALWIVDTGGMELGTIEGLRQKIRDQVDAAIEEADLVLFVIDGVVGLTTEDDEIVRRLARLSKPVLCAANKVDDDRRALDATGLMAGPLGYAHPVAAINGRGVGELMDSIFDKLPDAEPAPPVDENVVRIAIVGRPNVGKSSLVNSLLGEEKMIVSELAGTTRDAVDTELEYEGRQFLLIDTAGLRKRARIQPGLEYWSTLRSVRAIDRCDVAAVVLDATEPIGEQDVKIAAEAFERDKSVLLVVNKWDAVEKDPKVAERFEDRRAFHFTFVADAPIVYASALSGRRVDRILREAIVLADRRNRRVTTAKLNDMLARYVAENPPSNGRSGRATRILYAAQVDVRPPAIAVFTNRPELVEGGYARYLRNRIKDELDLAGTPVKILVRKRESAKKAESAKKGESPKKGESAKK